jgi:diguanylate cyclase (GGDEF)-like protein
MDKTEDIGGNKAERAVPFTNWYKGAANSSSVYGRRWPSRKWDGSRSVFLELQKNIEKYGGDVKNTVDSGHNKVFAAANQPLQVGSEAEIDQLMADLQDYVDVKKRSDDSVDAAVALVEYIQFLVDDASVVIEEQEKRIRILERFNTTDVVTGLTNKEGFVRVFEKELDRCRRGKGEGGLLVNIDVENIDKIIDSHGQKVADLCLQKVARTIQNQIRMMDVAARTGDDEFVVLMTNTNKYEASDRAQDMAWQLGHLSLSYNGKEIPIWSSLGLKTYTKTDMLDGLLGPEQQTKSSKEDETV